MVAMAWFDRWRRLPSAPDAERELFRDPSALWVHALGTVIDHQGHAYCVTRVESRQETGKLGFPVYLVFGKPVPPS
jgi:hypothetical protein